MSNKEFKYYYIRTSYFSEEIIRELLNKRNSYWIPSKKLKPGLDLCWLGGYHKTCTGARDCYKKFYQNVCSSSVSGDIEISLSNYIYKSGVYSLSDKKKLYDIIEKKYGKKKYLPMTINLNKSNLKTIDRKIFQGDYFYLKPVEGYERQGQKKIKTFEEVEKQLKEFKNFKNWQLQEFVKSYTKHPSFFRVVSVIVYRNEKLEYYISSVNEFAGVTKKGSTNVEHNYGSEWKEIDEDCHILEDFDKKDYQGKIGFAEEIYDNLLGKGYYMKKIFPQVKKILRDCIQASDLKDFRSKKDKIKFHVFGTDLMLDDKLQVKLLEYNLYPTHFMSFYLNCNSKEKIAKSWGGMNNFDKFYKYETDLFDEILSVTLDKFFETKYRKKREILKKIL